MPSLIQRASGVIFAAWISSIAAVYHIGPARADKTFAAVVGKLNPGDTLYVDGNATYAAVTFTRPGTAAAPIVVQGLAAEGKRPLISGGAQCPRGMDRDPARGRCRRRNHALARPRHSRLRGETGALPPRRAADGAGMGDQKRKVNRSARYRAAPGDAAVRPMQARASAVRASPRRREVSNSASPALR